MIKHKLKILCVFMITIAILLCCYCRPKEAEKESNTLAFYYYCIGNNKGLRGDHIKSIALLNKAIALNPTYVDAHFSLAEVYLLNGYLKLALEEFETSLVLYKTNNSKVYEDICRMKIDEIKATLAKSEKNDEEKFAAKDNIDELFDNFEEYIIKIERGEDKKKLIKFMEGSW